MRTLDNKNKPCVIVLGFFDSLHIGHVKVIEKAKKLAKKLDANVVAFSFSGNLKKALKTGEQTTVFNFFERKKMFKELGVNKTFFMPVKEQYLSLSKKQFLDFLIEKFNVLAFVSGEDFRFGFKAEGDVEYLKTYADERNLTVLTVKTVKRNAEKVSTTKIKELLKNGEIKKANKLLGRKFFVSGKVYKDRGIGKTLSFPTANVKVPIDKSKLKNGVYDCDVKVDGKIKKAVVNYGVRPTFNQKRAVIEAHILDFNEDLYGKKITIFFNNFLRDEKKFDSIVELKKQIAKDVKRVNK